MSASSSTTTPEQWAGMSKIVQQFFNKPDAEPFREAVDYQALGLHDYPQIIKHPMDLGTVQQKLVTNQYSTIFQAADDVRLVWTNCMTYNADGSDFYLLAQGLSKKWEEKYSKLLKDLDIVAPPPLVQNKESTTSLEEKRVFAKNLYKLSKEALGMLLVELDEKCPQAVVKNASEDEYVECRQCHILKQNEEYFEQAKQVVNKRHRECKPMSTVAEQAMDYGIVVEEDSPELAIVENAASTAFVPRQSMNEDSHFGPQMGLHETVFAYRTSYQ